MCIYDNVYSFDDIKEYMIQDALGLPFEKETKYNKDYDYKFEIKGEVFANILIDLLKHLK